MDILYKNEKPLFVISLIFSILIWLLVILGTAGVALVWILFFFIFYLFVQSGLIAYLKGTAVKITPNQFPDLHNQLIESCKKLNITNIPEAYMLQANGAFNAFATRFLRRHYVVVFSDVVSALESRTEALNFYFGHELGHIQRNHLLWGPILSPAGVLPLLGAAYSRAREYTCDNYGLACCSDPDDALKGLAALSAGSTRWQSLSIERYVDQAKESGSFWMSFHELIADYPWLVKRMARISSKVNKTSLQLPRRHPIAWLFALFVPRTGARAGGGSVLVMVAIIGILAAIAIPGYIGMKERARRAATHSELLIPHDQQEEFLESHNRYTQAIEKLDLTPHSE